MLPTPGEVLVHRGQKVEALSRVATAHVPSRYRVIDVARRLAHPEANLDQVMLKAEGDSVERNELIAAAGKERSLFRRSVRAPAAGRIAAIGPGWVLLETEAATVEVQAFINGVVSWVAPDGRGVVIQANGTLVEAACGFGGEAYGLFKRLTNSPFDPLVESSIDASTQDTIILGGRTLDEATLRKAEEMRVRGIIVGSFETTLMQLQPPPKVRVIATEGFGHMPMSPYTFGVLRNLSGKEISIRACTPFPNDEENNKPIIAATTTKASSIPTSSTLEERELEDVGVGSRVRITRGRLLGSIGTVASIPAESQPTQAGIIAAGANVKVDDATSFVPWANLEQIK